MKSNRIITKLTSSNDDILSGWQLQELISLMSSSYYKLDIINEVLEGIKKNKSFFIVDRSFEINNNYKKIRNSDNWSLNNKSNVESLYNLGKPIALVPDGKIQNIYYIFKYYEKIYTLFGKYKIEKIDKSVLKDLINAENGIDLLKEIVDKKIYALKTEKFMKDDFQKKSNKIYSDICKEISNSKEDLDKVQFFAEKLNDNISVEEYLKKEEYKIIERKYFQKFYTLLKRLDRPIIFSYDKDNNEIEIVKKQYICNDNKSDSFFDVKQYSHNSPFEIIFIGGTMMIPMLAFAISKMKKEKNKKLDNELSTQIEVELETAATKDECYISTKLKNVDQNIKSKVEKKLNKYDLINEKIVIDFQTEKEKRR